MPRAQTLGRAVLEIATDDTRMKDGIAASRSSIKEFQDAVGQWSGQVKRSLADAGASAKAFSDQFGDVFGDKASNRAMAATQNIMAIGGAVKLTDQEVKEHLATIDAWVAKAGKLGTEVSPAILNARASLQ